ncbi:hypothetical protein [Uliginosibacterium sp. H1]|nr:hypothetical protein [Uliginosibacterium sp. H1]
MNKLAQALQNIIRTADGVACARGVITRGVTVTTTLSTKKTTTKTTIGV